MLDKLKQIEINGKQYPMAFTLNVLEEIQERYGTLEKWQDKLSTDGDVPQMKDIKFTFLTMINEGIDIENEEKGEQRPFVTDKQVGRLLTYLGLNNVASEIFGVVASSTVTEGAQEDPNE